MRRRQDREQSVDISPEEYERQVCAWLKGCDSSIESSEVAHRSVVQGTSGEYEIDVVVRFRLFGGAELLILVECRRRGRRIERDDVMAFHSKLQDTGAHKGIMFATAGFQSGAIEYAERQGIATVRS